MKILFTLITLILTQSFVGCGSSNISLNQSIYKANIEGIRTSPFASASSMTVEVKRQKKVREQYESDLQGLLDDFSNKPIILVEDYLFECFGCVAEIVLIFVDGVLYQYNFNWTLLEYEKETKKLSIDDLKFEGGRFDEVLEIYGAILKGENWNQNPKKYGDEDCFDGGQTIYTVFTADKEIESMYIRCWTPLEFRD